MSIYNEVFSKESKKTNKRISQEVSLTSNMNFINTDLPDIVELKNIKQTYDNGKMVILNGLNFLIEQKPNQGQFICLLGTSGCGKSTLLRYICGLQKPTEGEVLIKGKLRSREDRVGMVFQTYSSLPWYTVYQNVELPLRYSGISKKERKELVMHYINLVGLSGHEHKYAQYPTLSGGQLQRVSIARSLIAKPDVLCMDEPFGALDIKTRLEMQELIAKIWLEMSSTTVIFVTHDISEAVFLGDDLYIMKANPGEFKYYHHIELPLERDREMKRDQYFLNKVWEIEEQMYQLYQTK